MKFALCFVAIFCLTSSQVLKLADELIDVNIKIGVKLDAEIVLGTIDADLLLSEEVIYQKSEVNRVVTTFASFHGELNVVIKAVQIIPNEYVKGSTITLTSGGIGQNFITLRVDSQLGQGNELTFRVYGTQ